MPSSLEIERILRAAGLRVTRPRIAVLDAVYAHPHADTGTVIEAARRSMGDVSHQAVYDVLEVLTLAGLVRRIQPSRSAARYEARVDDNHHHMVCRACGAVADVDCAVGSVPCLTPSQHHGYTIDEAEVIYWGLCPSCSGLGAQLSPTADSGPGLMSTDSERTPMPESERTHLV